LCCLWDPMKSALQMVLMPTLTPPLFRSFEGWRPPSSMRGNAIVRTTWGNAGKCGVYDPPSLVWCFPIHVHRLYCLILRAESWRGGRGSLAERPSGDPTPDSEARGPCTHRAPGEGGVQLKERGRASMGPQMGESGAGPFLTNRRGGGRLETCARGADRTSQ